MKKQKWIRKGLAMLLSLAMVVGLIPAMSGEAVEVQAATENGTGSTPSVTAYATKEQMMGGTFAPDSNGNATNIGKLVFGKDENGKAQEWYILGKDTGVTGDNTIIFAASPIVTKQAFQDNYYYYHYYIKYDTNWGCTYPDGVNLDYQYVCPNHYGPSTLRAVLKDMVKEGNTDYFTATEQTLINPTTVKSWDMKWDKQYTTTDKLYALNGKRIYNNNGTYSHQLLAGSEDGTVLHLDSALCSGENFWLRALDDSCTSDDVCCKMLNTSANNYVWGMDIMSSYAVRPASNLNLSKALFASAATSASDDVSAATITSGTAMTLRLDASATAPATAVGTVIYDASTGVIAAQKNADATGNVSLVVQGKGTIDETEQDWYYSVPVGGTIAVTAEQIQQKLSLSVVPDLTDCQIWLETTIDNVAYASTAKAVETMQVENVNSVAVTDVKPVGGEAFNTVASCNTKGIATTTPAITYTTTGENGEEEVTGIADWNATYKAAFTLITGIVNDVAYVFDSSVSVTVDGKALLPTLIPKLDGTLTVTKEFTTAKRKIVSVAAPEVPTDNTFTTYYGFEGNADTPISGISTELGNQGMVTLEGTALVDSTNEAMNVTWTIANDGEAAYDRTPGAENTFRWTIPASEFQNYDASACQGYDAATGDITDTVTITNKAATPVTITGTDSSVAYTGATIDVSKNFTIDSHAGNATYSLVTGVDGGTGVGTLSGTTLTVTKTGTFKIKVETLANGIYGAGEKTITLTVSNGTIEYTATGYSGTYDGQPHSISVNVTNPEGTIISYSTDGENYGSDNPSFTNAGTYTVYYRITKDNYNTISKNSTVNVAKAASAPNQPDSTMDVDYGKEKVSDITTLPEGWAWKDVDKDKALTVGTAVKATAVYTGADKGNYEVESVEISITRAECTHATTEVKGVKEATCTEKGYTGDTYCTICGEKVKIGQDIDALGHKWDAGKVEVTNVTKKEVEYKGPANKKAKTVSIPATVRINGVTYKVTKIADNAFKGNKTVTKITIGSNIKTIGKNAFYKCTKLKTVKIGKNVTTIGSKAFKGCTSLTSVTLPGKTTKIGANAFNGCKKLKTIKITSTKLTSKTVSKNAFKGLTKATTIKVPKKKLSAYKKLFKQKGLSSKVKVKGY